MLRHSYRRREERKREKDAERTFLTANDALKNWKTDQKKVITSNIYKRGRSNTSQLRLKFCFIFSFTLFPSIPSEIFCSTKCIHRWMRKNGKENVHSGWTRTFSMKFLIITYRYIHANTIQTRQAIIYLEAHSFTEMRYFSKERTGWQKKNATLKTSIVGQTHVLNCSMHTRT